MIIALGSDHRGYAHKSMLLDFLRSRGIQAEDLGCSGPAATDYPDAAFAVGEMVASGRAGAGVLICGSGIGMSIAANKVAGVRASLCFTADQARATRRHNDSNVLCLSGDVLEPDTALAVFDAWISAAFAGGRHGRRVDKITAYEKKHLIQE